VYGGIPFIISTILFVPYTLLLNLKFPLFFILFGLAQRRKLKRFLPPAWFVAGFLALFLDYFTPQVFPWFWGNLLAGQNAVAQIAEITGVYGLSFLLFSISYVLYRIFFRSLFTPFRAKRKKSVWFHKRALRFFVLKRIFPVPVLLIFLYIFGFIRIFMIDSLQKQMPHVKVAVLQPNTPLDQPGGDSSKKLNSADIKQIIEVKIPELARKAYLAGGPFDLIVLPEAGIPGVSTQDNLYTRRTKIYSEDLVQMVKRLTYEYNAELILNELGLEVKPGPFGLRAHVYNASSVHARDGQMKDRYYKKVLIAFGEYIPGVEFLEATGIINLVPALSGLSPFSRGDHQRSMPFMIHKDKTEKRALPENLNEAFLHESFTPSGTFIPSICYEILYPEHNREFFLYDDPGFIVNMTQDGWYGKTIETYEHFELGRMRSIELRRPIVRSTNSGSSGYVDAAGRYTDAIAGPKFSPQEEESFQVFSVPVMSGIKTVYMYIGNSWMILIALLFLGHLVHRVIKVKGFLKNK